MSSLLIYYLAYKTVNSLMGDLQRLYTGYIERESTFLGQDVSEYGYFTKHSRAKRVRLKTGDPDRLPVGKPSGGKGWLDGKYLQTRWGLLG